MQKSKKRDFLYSIVCCGSQKL